MDYQDILNSTENYLQKCVAPHAEIIDSDSEALKTALAGLEDRSLLALRVPQKWGGAGNCTGDFLPISGIDGSIFRCFVFSANSAPQRNFHACQQRQ